MPILREKIKEYLNEINMPTYLWEKKLNLGSSVIAKILDQKKNRYPSVENLVIIADEMQCSTDDLLGRKGYSKYDIDYMLNDVDYNHELFRSVFLYVFHQVEEQRINISHTCLIVRAIEEIYKFCFRKGFEKVDSKIANYYLNKILNKDLNHKF